MHVWGDRDEQDDVRVRGFFVRISFIYWEELRECGDGE